MENARRQASVEKTISEINEKDFRVRILGTVVDRDEANNSCVIDDGTDRATAFFADQENLSLVETGKRLRIIGKVRKDNEIDVEIIQDMSMLDPGLLEQAGHILEKLR
ncbi:MAG: hypothetical protein V3V36_01710 [Candidatus Hydrothermarchaeaceae archaeon]